MKAYNEKIGKVWELNKSGNEIAALELLLVVYDSERDCLNSVSYRLLFKLMRKCNRTERAQEIYESLHDDVKRDEQTVIYFYWIVYDKLKITDDAQKFLVIADWLFKMSSTNEYSPQQKVVWVVCKRLWREPAKDWAEFEKWLDRSDVEKLSKENKITKINNREKEIASDYETWHYWKIKSLYKLSLYNDVIVLGHRTMDLKDIKFVYLDFICSLIAQAYIQIGDAQNAISFLDKCKKREWYILFNRAKVLESLNRLDDAITNALEAIVAKGVNENKIHLYMYLAELLSKKDQRDELIIILYRAYIMCRNKLGVQKVDISLNDAISEHGLNIHEEYSEQYISRLISLCEDRLSANQPIYEGTISQLLEHRNIGFIKFDNYTFSSHGLNLDSAIFYFGENNPIIMRNASIGDKVRFYLKPSFDKKKNRPACTAYDLQKII